jgi:hypothetical protein
MAQILTGPTPSQVMARNIGDPIRQSLERLTQMQLNNIAKQRQRSDMMAGLSTMMSPEQANMMSNLPPEMLKTIIPQMQKQQQMKQGLENYRAMRAKEQEGVVPTEESTSEETKAQEAYEKAYTLSNGNVAVALRAEEDVRKRSQRAKIAEDKKIAEFSKVKEGRITAGLTSARKKAEETQGRIESYRGSIDAYKNIRTLLKSGKPVTGLPANILKRLGIDKSVTGWETQVMDKLFAGEPIRALRSLPAQAARLTKVFETLKDMHGSLVNTPEGMDAIARTKIVEAKAAKALDKAYIQKLEEYRKKGKDIPFDLRNKTAKQLSPKLNKYGSEMQYIISDNIEKTGAKLSEYKFGEKIISDDGSNRVFIKKKVYGKPTWIIFESE